MKNSFFLDKSDIIKSTKPSRSKKIKSEKIYDCSTCGLAAHCKHPKIKRFGEGRKGILIIGRNPGKDEDWSGVPFVGKSGQMLKRFLAMLNIDLDIDCIRTNAVACFKETAPSPHELLCCRQNLLRDIQETKPKLIICLGDEAVKSVIDKPKSIHRFNVGIAHGRTFPYHKFNCWIGCAYHPSFFLHRKSGWGVPDDELLLVFDLAKIINHLNKELPKPLTESGNIVTWTVEQAIEAIKKYTNINNPIHYDYETTTLSPLEEEADIVCWSITDNIDKAMFIPYKVKHPETGEYIFNDKERKMIDDVWCEFLKSSTPKTCQNINMEEIWNRAYFKTKMNNFIHDTMVGSHGLNCCKYSTSLAFQTFEMTGHVYKGIVNRKDIQTASFQDLVNYSCWDSRYGLMAYYWQIERMKKEGRVFEFNQFYQRGAAALVGLKERGISIDFAILDELSKKYEKERTNRIKGIRELNGVKKYTQEVINKKNSNKFAFDLDNDKNQFNPDSPVQLGHVLYDIHKEPKEKNSLTALSVLQRILQNSKNYEVKKLISSILRIRKCDSLIERVKNYYKVRDNENKVHPNYNLNICDSFRSSASDPNIQNVFRKDKELKVFRRAIKPSKGRVILEVDRSSIEVCVIAMHSKDKVLIKQLQDKYNFHRYWASEIFKVPEDQVTYEMRDRAKNKFNFPSFYGSIPSSIARDFPKISAKHISNTQAKFWDMYKGAKEWQNDTIEKYKSVGYVEGLTGWRNYGPLTINQICNIPIQGDAFHLTLDSIIRLELEELLIRNGFDSTILFEVHDSIEFDAIIDEIPDLVKLIEKIMCTKWFDWCGEIPLSVEWKISKNNWYEMKDLDFRICSKCGNNRPHSKDAIKKDNEIITTFECLLCENIEKEKIIVK